MVSGYYQLPECTEEQFYIDQEDGQRWFRTGDIGQIDTNDAVLRIIDRKKDLVKLQMGEYVSLGKVESSLKIHPLVENICVVADSSKNYCVALIVPDAVKLSDMASNLDIIQRFEELCRNPFIVEAVANVLTSFAQDELQKFEIPRRFALIQDAWTPENGFVTAAMKLRRKIIYAHYKDTIQTLYQLEPCSLIASSSIIANDSPRSKIKLA